MSYDDKIQYIGYGSFPKPTICNDKNQIMASGPILLSPPGAHLVCGKVNIDRTSAYYLRDHAKLKWVATNSTELLKVPGTLKLDGGKHFQFMFGRVSQGGAYRVGKLHAGPNDFGLWYEKNNGESATNYFDVLTCD